MALQINDVIPLGKAPGIISLMVNDNGLLYLPPNHIVKGRGNSGYWSVDVPLDTVNAVALRLLGVAVVDIIDANSCN